MANILKREKQVRAISALAEGSSIRSIERMTGIHRDTIMRLRVKVGKGCTQILDKMMNNLRCRRIQIDEIWGFIGKKQKHVKYNEFGVGNVWTFVAIDPESKVVPCFKVGQRDSETSNQFICDFNYFNSRKHRFSDSCCCEVRSLPFDCAQGRLRKESRDVGNPLRCRGLKIWIPAFAGMTNLLSGPTL